MKNNLDTTELLEIVAEETSAESFRKILSRVVENYPEISEQILNNLKLKQSFDAGHIEIISANELSEAEKSHIEKSIGESGEYKFAYTVNPEIIGGIIIKNGENITDNSMRTRLEKAFNQQNSNIE